jgi:hypothetical protein
MRRFTIPNLLRIFKKRRKDSYQDRPFRPCATLMIRQWEESGVSHLLHTGGQTVENIQSL